MTLEQPVFLLFLLVIPALLYGAWHRNRNRDKQWEKLLILRLRKTLARGASQKRHWVSLSLGLAGLGLLVIALSRPIAGYSETEENLQGRNILIAVDVSRSMLVKDISPSRLEFARVAAMEIVEAFPSDRIGLLAFAGSAFLQAPLTHDHGALRETINQLDTASIPSGGSDLQQVFKEALSIFRQTGKTSHALILLSDGEHHGDDFKDLAEEAQELKVTILPIGVGDSDGGFVPDSEQRDGNYRDKNGNAVLSRLNESSLRKMAQMTGGFYINGASANFIQIIQKGLEELEEYQFGERKRKVANPRYQWFLIPSVMFLFASLLTLQLWPERARDYKVSQGKKASLVRAMPFILVWVFLLGGNGESEAGVLEAYKGQKALKEGEYERAAEIYEELIRDTQAEGKIARYNLGLGFAQMAQEEYEAASRSFSQALLSSDGKVVLPARYNLASSLYELGRVSLKAQESEATFGYWESAVEHLEDILSEQEHPESEENLRTIKEELEKLRQQENKEKEQKQEEEKDQEDSEKSDEKKDKEEQESGEQEEEQEQDKEGGEESSSDGESQDKEEEDSQEQGEDEEEESEEENQENKEEGEKKEEAKQEEASEKQKGSQQEQNKQETPEEKAYRLLQTFADFQKQEPLQRRKQPRRVEKDW